MKQILYAMQFTGQAQPSAESGALTAKTSSPSSRITTTAGAGLTGTVEAIPGGSAAFESSVTFTGDSSFLESGSIDFGGGNRFQFITVGQGFLGASADATLKHGAVIWKLDSGEGQFAGATGLITSNFTVGGAGEVVDNHFGVIFLA
jgi:hypothetical protein